MAGECRVAHHVSAHHLLISSRLRRGLFTTGTIKKNVVVLKEEREREKKKGN
jgi:hypothetical protein